MVRIDRQKYCIRICEKYFVVHPELSLDNSSDIVFYVQSPQKFEGCTIFENLIVDLMQDKEVLFSGIKKGTKYEINRAVNKDGNLFTSYVPTIDQVGEFKKKFDNFAVSKNIGIANYSKMCMLRANGSLLITYASKGEQIETYHVYICDYQVGRVRLLYSLRVLADDTSKENRAFSGRQNRALHWKDFELFKEMGFITYDFGGAGTHNAAVKAVTQFKQEFGGKETVEYNGMIGNTLKGKIALRLYKLLGGL